MFVLVGKDVDDVIVIDRNLLAELRLYWPSCSVSADFVAHMIWTVFAI